jgi:hypothetical protein
MSVDTVNVALSTVRRSILEHPENFSERGRRLLLAICENMRDSLMKGYIDDFNRYVDGLLGCEPDAADYVLEELFDALGITDRQELCALLVAS